MAFLWLRFGYGPAKWDAAELGGYMLQHLTPALAAAEYVIQYVLLLAALICMICMSLYPVSPQEFNWVSFRAVADLHSP